MVHFYFPITGTLFIPIDTALGRYLQADPLGDGLNLYAYCFNNPVGLVDPLGLCAVKAAFSLQGQADFWAGFGDFLTSGFGLAHLIGVPGITEYVRQQWNDQFWGGEDYVNYGSGMYAAGLFAGDFVGAFLLEGALIHCHQFKTSGWLLKANSASKRISDPRRLLPETSGSNPHLEGGPMYGVELPRGYTFNQAVGFGQKSPGAFGTPSEITSVNFFRNDLAVIPDWKPLVSGSRAVRVERPVRAQISIVGPQEAGGITYPGGKVQI